MCCQYDPEQSRVEMGLGLERDKVSDDVHRMADMMRGYVSAVVVLTACGQAHVADYFPCETVGPEGCAAGQVCRETAEGELRCMPVCDAGEGRLCPNGAACVHRRPGPEWVCWTGGALAQGEPCDHPVYCAWGLTCNRDEICEQACDGAFRNDRFECDTVGHECIGGMCRPPIPAGTPCTESNGIDCGGATCLPDPEAPETWICWPGGPVRSREPCSDSYQCSLGDGCSSDGVCNLRCHVNDEPCRTTLGHTCRDYVCTRDRR